MKTRGSRRVQQEIAREAGIFLGSLLLSFFFYKILPVSVNKVFALIVLLFYPVHLLVLAILWLGKERKKKKRR